MRAFSKSDLRLAALRLRCGALITTLAAVSGLQSAQAQSLPTPATSWELAGQFNGSNNTNAPGQVWTFGREFFPGSGFVFNLLTPGSFLGPVSGWKSLNNNWAPAVYQNTGSTPYSGVGPVIQPKAVVMLAGFNCERTVVRFTPPVAAQYRVSGQFYGLADGNSTTGSSVAVTRRSGNTATPVHTGTLAYPNKMQSSFTSKSVMLKPTDALDFEVGCGTGGGFPMTSFMTGVHAVVERQGDYCKPGSTSSDC